MREDWNRDRVITEGSGRECDGEDCQDSEEMSKSRV